MLAASRFLARLRPTIIKMLPWRLDMSAFLASTVHHKLLCLGLAYYVPLI
jgi:hypothetical protein